MATTLERVRRAISDKPTYRRESVTAQGGVTRYQLDHSPISDLVVSVDSVVQTLTTHYTVDEDNGVIDFVTAPTANSTLLFTYYSLVWTDIEIQDYLDQYGDNVNISAAHILMAWAADVARLAKRETRSGGGGLGSITVDTSVAAKELRNTAKALMDWELEYGDDAGTSIAAEGITEVPWTEAAFHDIEDQSWLREN